MPAMSDPTTWRTFKYTRSYLYIDKPVAVFKARVTFGTAYNDWYPITYFPYDGKTLGLATDVIEGMTLTLGSTDEGDDYGRTMALYATSDIIAIPRTSRGVNDGEVTIVEDAYLTIWDDYRLWPIIPFIGNTGVTLKAGVWAYTEGLPTLPVANMGRGICTIDFVNPSTNILTVAFNCSTSHATDPGTTTALTYLWDFEDGTITVGTTSSATPTVTFPPGKRWITLRVRDVDGDQYLYRKHLVVAMERTGANAPISNFEVTSSKRNAKGHALSVAVHSDIDISDYPDGTLVALVEEEVYGNVLVAGAYSVTGMNVTQPKLTFSGWHHSDRTMLKSTSTGYVTETILECVDVGLRLAQLPAFPQIIERDAAPASWDQLETANIDRFLHYLLLWHSRALQLTDFIWSGQGSSYPIARLSSRGSNLWDQVDGRAQAVAHNLTCDRLGRLHIKKDNMLWDTGSRGSTVMHTLSDDDWSEINYSKVRPPRVHWLRSNAIIVSAVDADALTADDINAVFCVSPGDTPGFGSGSQTHGESLVVSQTELNAREGHRYNARLNADLSVFDVTLTCGGNSTIDPAMIDEWVVLSVSATYAAQRGLVITSGRFMVHEVSTVYQDNGNKTVTLSIEQEGSGQPAQTYYPPAASTATPTYTSPYDIYQRPDYNASDTGLYLLPSTLYNLAMFDTAGNLIRTTDFDTPYVSGGPTWEQVILGSIGTVYQFVVDPFSYGTATIDGWLFTSLGVYKVTDIGGTTPSIASQYTWPITFDVNNDKLNADASFAEDGWVMCIVSDANGGTCCAYTTDGATWNWVQITAFNETSSSFDHTPFCYCSSLTSGFGIASAFTTTASGTAAMGVFQTANKGATWAAYTGGITFTTQHGLGEGIELPFHDNAAETIAYYGYRNVTDVGAGKQTLKTYRSVGATQTDITPVVGGLYYQPRGRWKIKTAPTDRHKVVLAAYGEKPDASVYGYRAVFVSPNDGTTWTTIVAPVSGTNTYTHAAISGDNGDVIYLWGGQGRIAISVDVGATIDDRRGNMADLVSIGEIIGICGLPT